MRSDNNPDQHDLKYAKNIRSNEEIDLLNIMVLLWREKLIIISFIIVALVGAFLLNTFIKKEWTSTAVLTLPSAGQVADYNVARNLLYTVSSEPRMSLPDLQQQVFSRFIEVMYASAPPKSARQFRVVSNTVARGGLLKLSYTAESMKIAQKKLQDFIGSLDEKVADDYHRDFQYKLDSRKKELSVLLLADKKIAEHSRDFRLAMIKRALKVAQDNQVDNVSLSASQPLSDDTLFLLGTRALTVMIDNYKNQPLHFNDDYYRTQKSLLTIEELNTDIKGFQAYRYVIAPDMQLDTGLRNSLLKYLLAFVLGGIIGSCVVLARHLIRNYQPHEPKM